MDTLRADHTGAYGYAWGTTPNLDRIARESVVLAKMRSHAPETRDSHMAMFTSQHPFVHQRVGALPTLAEVLRESGFATVGLTDGGQVSHSFGFDRGFDLYVDKGGALRRHIKDFDKWLDQRMLKKVAAMLSGGLFNVRLEGSGMLAITTHYDPLTLRVTPGQPVYTDPNATIAWSGNLQPEFKTDVSLKTFIGRGSGESMQMMFNGDGFVVVQPYEEVYMQHASS